jgi:hypothetical protein
VALGFEVDPGSDVAGPLPRDADFAEGLFRMVINGIRNQPLGAEHRFLAELKERAFLFWGEGDLGSRIWRGWHPIWGRAVSAAYRARIPTDLSFRQIFLIKMSMEGSFSCLEE